MAFVLLVAAGCTSGSDGGDGDSDGAGSPGAPRASSPAAEGSSPAIDPGRLSPDDLPTIPKVAKQGAQGALADVEFGTCPTGPGEVALKATVTNPTKAATDYAVVVSWINATNDELGRAVAAVRRLRPGEERVVLLRATLAGDADLTCAFNVMRGSLRR